MHNIIIFQTVGRQCPELEQTVNSENVIRTNNRQHLNTFYNQLEKPRGASYTENDIIQFQVVEKEHLKDTHSKLMDTPAENFRHLLDTRHLSIFYSILAAETSVQSAA